MGNHVKTTVELPDELLVAAKKRAAETRTTLRRLLERGLRRELETPMPGRRKPRKIRWVTAKGGLPPGLDLSDRTAMQEWIQRER
jgi:hypothetical protein